MPFIVSHSFSEPASEFVTNHIAPRFIRWIESIEHQYSGLRGGDSVVLTKLPRGLYRMLITHLLVCPACEECLHAQVIAGSALFYQLLEPVFNALHQIRNDAASTVDAKEPQEKHKRPSIKIGTMFEATIVAMNREEIWVENPLIAKAILPFNELRPSGYASLGEVHIGDRILVIVIHVNPANGLAIVSARKAYMRMHWKTLRKICNRGEIITAQVKGYNTGGLIVTIYGIRGFIPLSQLVICDEGDFTGNSRTLIKLKSLVGKILFLKIISVKRSKGNLILSERSAMKEVKARERRDSINKRLSELEVGKIYPGSVHKLTSFGAFIELEGVLGLLDMSEYLGEGIKHPKEILHIGQPIDVQIVQFDREWQRVFLSTDSLLCEGAQQESERQAHSVLVHEG